MKKINFYQGDSLEFHKNVIKAKRNTKKDPSYTKRMESRECISKKQFIEYDARFLSNTLEGMSKVLLTNGEKEDYLRLYRYKDKCFQDLEKELSCDEYGHEYPYCPICDIGEYHTLDHILPKGEFPVLCDHPKNLIRSCTICNGYKSEIWLESGKRKFLNLYIDDIPNEQMLFVKLEIKNDLLTYEYYVSDINHPDPELYRMYKNSFDRFELAKRYKKQTNEEVTNMIVSMKDSITQFHATDEQLRNSIETSIRDLQIRHGVNYWRAILKQAICSDNVMFMWMKRKAG